jgi:hypothetical protein
LYDCKIRGIGVDKLWWLHSCKGEFEVKSFYQVLSPPGSSLFPWKSIWNLRPHLEWRFSLGQLLGAKFLLWITLGGGVWWW